MVKGAGGPGIHVLWLAEEGVPGCDIVDAVEKKYLLLFNCVNYIRECGMLRGGFDLLSAAQAAAANLQKTVGRPYGDDDEHSLDQSVVNLRSCKLPS